MRRICRIPEEEAELLSRTGSDPADPANRGGAAGIRIPSRTGLYRDITRSKSRNIDSTNAFPLS